MLTDKELYTLRQLISLQVSAMSGEDGLLTSVDTETITVIPFTDKVEIVVSPDLIEDYD